MTTDLVGRARRLGLSALVAGGILFSQAPTAMADLAGFDRFARAVGPACAQDAATTCFAKSFAYADRDGDRRLSLDEVERVRLLLGVWAERNWDELSAIDRHGITLGLWIVDLVGLEPLFASYDADGDGYLTADELSADIRLDSRPLPEILRDREAVDWASINRRLGIAARLLEGLWPASLR